MICSQSALAKKYATAYLNVYQDQLEVADIDHIRHAYNFLSQQKNFMSLVSLLHVRESEENEIVTKFFSLFFLPDSLKQLVRILLQKKRLPLFPAVLRDICCLYGLRYKIVDLVIKTAAPLGDKEKEAFEKFFADNSGMKVKSTIEEDPSLIAGVRLQSNSFLWEHSVAGKLRELQQTLLIEE